jgi:hypothetical protein
MKIFGLNRHFKSALRQQEFELTETERAERARESDATIFLENIIEIGIRGPGFLARLQCANRR